MRTIIIEDDNLMLEAAKIIIEKNNYLNIVEAFNDANEALERLEELHPEVVFLDVEMPNISGIQVAKKIEKFNSNIQIVFVTAYEKYALDAFKVSAADYIVKPITEEQVNATVKKLIKYKDGIRFFEKETNRSKICTFGNFEVYGNKENELIKWPTAKVEELFAYFVVNRGNEVDRWILCDLLWPNASPEKALHNLHNSIYRLKNILKNNAIEANVIYENRSYKMNFNTINCDLWKYEDYIKLNLEIKEQNIEEYEKIIKLYKGSLFENKDYLWAIDLKVKLDEFFLSVCKSLAKYFYNRELYYKSEEYLRRIIRENPLDEDLVDLAMKTNYQFKNKIGIINTYNSLKKVLIEEIDAFPRESTKKLYLELINKL